MSTYITQPFIVIARVQRHYGGRGLRRRELGSLDSKSTALTMTPGQFLVSFMSTKVTNGQK